MAIYSATAAWMLAGSIYASPPPVTMFGLLASTLLAIYFAAGRNSAALATFCVACASLCAAWSLMALGYAVHHYGRGAPLIDPFLQACDEAFGFDWGVVLRIFDATPRITALLGLLYLYCPWELHVALLAALWWRQYLRLLTLIAANFALLTIVHWIAFFLPAIGAYGFLKLDPGMHPHVALVSTDLTVGHVLRLRQATELVFPDQLLGLVNFPSYHTAVAVLFGWFFWRSPLRWPAVAVNGALAVATVIHGSHYLVDVIAGAALTAAVTMLFCRWLSDPVVAPRPEWRATATPQPT